MSQKLTLPALDPATLAPRVGSGYPEIFRAQVAGREKRALGDAVGLTHYGVNLVKLPPGAWSAQRHYHTAEDEFVYILEGEVTLVSEGQRQILKAGMVAGFPAGKADGHCLVNHTERPALYLEIGDRSEVDECHYPDIDLHLKPADGDFKFFRKDGRPY